jgi:hypothetical protein
MKLTTLHDQLVGEWAGKSRLWRNWLPGKETCSGSRLSVRAVAQGKFLSFAYTWELDGESQEGFLLIGNENEQDQVSGAWGDSWHQGGSLLVLNGTLDESGTVVLHGTFPAPPQPDWGWKITIAKASPQLLRLTMYVIPWNGAEELAVQGDYERV